jgi:hypothetical protein
MGPKLLEPPTFRERVSMIPLVINFSGLKLLYEISLTCSNNAPVAPIRPPNSAIPAPTTAPATALRSVLHNKIVLLTIAVRMSPTSYPCQYSILTLSNSISIVFCEIIQI